MGGTIDMGGGVPPPYLAAAAAQTLVLDFLDGARPPLPMRPAQKGP